MRTKAGSFVIVWIALAACGGGARSSAPPASGPTPSPTPVEQGAAEVSCQQAVDGMFVVTAAKEPPDLRARSAKVFVNRCETDRWSAEIRGCMAAVKVPEDGDGCEKLLTPEQKTELAHELSRELDAAGVKPEMESGRPKPKADAKGAPKPAPKAAKPNAAKEKAKPRASDPCEGGE